MIKISEMWPDFQKILRFISNYAKCLRPITHAMLQKLKCVTT